MSKLSLNLVLQTGFMVLLKIEMILRYKQNSMPTTVMWSIPKEDNIQNLLWYNIETMLPL